MNRIRACLTPLALLTCCLAGAAWAGQAVAPASYVDEGACPFECCTYGEWGVEQDVELRASPDPEAAVVGSAAKGSKLQALTGQVVISRPGVLQILKDYDSPDTDEHYRAGEIVLVYTQLGEGFFRLWHAGAMRDESAAFLLDGDGGFIGCVDDGTCWGQRISMPESTWWIQVRTPTGITGWTDQPERLTGQDGCG